MKRRSDWTTAGVTTAVVLVTALAGCVDGNSEETQHVSVSITQGTTPQAGANPFSAKLAGPVTVTDAKGRTWIGHPITRFATGEPDSSPPPEKSHTDAELDAMTDDELAAQFAPIKAVFDDDGNAAEYRLATISADIVASVQAARAKSHSGINMVAYGPGKVYEFFGKKPPPPPGAVAEPPSNTLVPQGPLIQTMSLGSANADLGLVRKSDVLLGAPRRLPGWWQEVAAQSSVSQFMRPDLQHRGAQTPLTVYGTEGRQWISPSDYDAYPWPSMANVRINPSSGGGGSATMIGAYTAIGAAHSFWSKTAHTWYTSHAWAIARIHTQDRSSIIYVNTYRGSPANGSTYSQCFSVTIPASFDLGYAEGDFSILDFYNCSSHPGSDHGWVWPGYSTTALDYATTLHAMVGYDMDTVPPQPSPVTSFYVKPSLITTDASPQFVASRGDSNLRISARNSWLRTISS